MTVILSSIIGALLVLSAILLALFIGSAVHMKFPGDSKPPPNPMAGKFGLTHELLRSLTDEELTEYETYLRWVEANSTYDEKKVYRSRAYAQYRHGKWQATIYEIRKERQLARDESQSD